MIRVSKSEFQHMRELGFIDESKNNRNYGKSRRYRYVQDDVYEDYKKILKK